MTSKVIEGQPKCHCPTETGIMYNVPKFHFPVYNRYKMAAIQILYKILAKIMKRRQVSREAWYLCSQVAMVTTQEGQ